MIGATSIVAGTDAMGMELFVFASDPERLARFEREAKTPAALIIHTSPTASA